MSGSHQNRDEGQDTSASGVHGFESQRHSARAQQGLQPPSAQQQAQYVQADKPDYMRMSSMQNSLPGVQNPVYSSGHQYPVINPAASYQSHPQGYPNAYHGYPQSPTQPGGVQYATYVDHTGHAVQYNPIQAQFAGGQVYTGPPQAQPYGMYPPGYGPPSPVQQRGFQGPPRQYSAVEYGQSGVIPVQGSAPGAGRSAFTGGANQPRTSPPVPAATRGPPRKPKQSGHALWVGNLPPGTRVSDLKDHFAREATKDIESVFLISKSNCAFVNYRSEEACAAAMSRFHDSRFQGVRLVTRLRKTPGTLASPGAGASPRVPSGPASQQQLGLTQSQSAVEAIAQNRESSQKATDSTQPTEVPANDKYFIVKSLTVEDLELSSRNGIWATQGHNEDALNKAYESVDNVYLIFSANKSGEYFGYAKMESSIDDETAKNLEWKSESVTRPETIHADPELPRSIPTVATEWAPKGRIIDDSARGTIFWEAESSDMEQESRESLIDGEEPEESDEEEEEEQDSEKEALKSAADEAGEASHQPFGRPFRVKWMSTTRLPFYRTRGLRNAWNSNREVKIARDGTELETVVGRRLVSMFRSPIVPALQMQQAQQYMGQLQSPMGYMPPYGRGF